MLHPRLEVAVARDARRSDWRAGAAGVESLWRKFSGERFDREAFLDTSSDTPEESAGRVLASLTREATAAHGIRHILVYSATSPVERILRFYRRCGFEGWAVQLVLDLERGDGQPGTPAS